ncbi:Golgi-associated plant pathogenesis-related protein 1-like isoform X2 [Acanthochromis polyacanthus]|uniref:Golgi-associated plant pathogenesis-related protein 1-like isoform X2 n=1 Tax=Acanthochromis polyacanthus TaxID=80966 RepID=UPI0022342DE8|nr:Golgi-associated plant pathogenesis-related protein 1-like isoform X2 [Acanthochromis polyacanthus]
MAEAGFRQEFLETHNKLRELHSASPLKYNSELNAAAQKWAEYLVTKGDLDHSKTEDGENVFFMSSSKPIKATGKEAVDSWYSEIKDYDWNNPGFQSNTGHFTQVVWKSSTELGVGVGVTTDGNTLFVVGQYRPPGNVLGSFPENVDKKSSE